MTTIIKKQRKPYKKPPLKEQLDNFIQELRMAVYPQIKEFKQSELLKSGGQHYLDKRNKKIRQREAQCDHVHPATFRQLVYDFCKLEKVNISTLKPTDITKLKDLFSSYHKDNAVLEMVHKNTNKWRFYRNRKNDIKWQQFFEVAQCN